MPGKFYHFVCRSLLASSLVSSFHLLLVLFDDYLALKLLSRRGETLGLLAIDPFSHPR
jgi:hypothetical protein